MTARTVIATAVLLAFFMPADGHGAPFASKSPFEVSASLSRRSDGGTELAVSFAVPRGHLLYSDKISVVAVGNIRLVAKQVPGAEEKKDPLLDEMVRVYQRDVRFTYDVEGIGDASSMVVKVELQGCSDELCFMPESREIVAIFEPVQSVDQGPSAPAAAQAVPRKSDSLKMLGSASGYMDVDKFLDFMDQVESGETADQNPLEAALSRGGPLLLVLAILVGGLVLNLTPCVLPMIPVNIAIIGAGAQAFGGAGGMSRAVIRMRGFLLGSAYGAGMTVIYGVLGLLVIETGARFGTLNSSPWFNGIIAAIFVLLSLGMFGVLTIDFTRFQAKLGRPSTGKRGTLAGAFMLGGVAALLAGACVAPPVISVLLLAAKLQAAGQSIGRALPFILGLGMGLPWAFVGAGFSFLPKPGKWMEYVKYGFGIIIMVFAAWYGMEAFRGMMDSSTSSMTEVDKAQEARVREGWFTSLEQGIEEAKREKKPVFVDFWASWCKNCLEMERTTFRAGEVIYRLQPYIKVKYRAQDLKDPAIKADLDRFGIIGLPTYVVLSVTETGAQDAP